MVLLFDDVGEKSHTIERQYNSRTKEGEEHHEFINLDDGEWCHHTCTCITQVPYTNYYVSVLGFTKCSCFLMLLTQTDNRTCVQ